MEGNIGTKGNIRIPQLARTCSPCVSRDRMLVLQTMHGIGIPRKQEQTIHGIGIPRK